MCKRARRAQLPSRKSGNASEAEASGRISSSSGSEKGDDAPTRTNRVEEGGADKPGAPGGDDDKEQEAEEGTQPAGAPCTVRGSAI